jgi:hypothetical protein
MAGGRQAQLRTVDERREHEAARPIDASKPDRIISSAPGYGGLAMTMPSARRPGVVLPTVWRLSGLSRLKQRPSGLPHEALSDQNAATGDGSRKPMR